MSNQIFSLSGKVAAISGCTRGIGRSMALALAEAGAGKFFFSVLFMYSKLYRCLFITTKC
jgi:hypothetical protein